MPSLCELCGFCYGEETNREHPDWRKCRAQKMLLHLPPPVGTQEDQLVMIREMRDVLNAFLIDFSIVHLLTIPEMEEQVSPHTPGLALEEVIQVYTRNRPLDS